VSKIPTMHSRKRLPRAVTDPAQLTEWTQEVLECPEGRLFAHLYKDPNILKKSPSTETAAAATSRINHKEDRETAWTDADPTVQKVEALIRGYAYLVEGTVWNRWVPKQNNDNMAAVDVEATTAMDAQHQLLMRINNEGHAYMVVRNLRLEELLGPQPYVPPEPEPTKQMPGHGDLCDPLDWKKYAMEEDLARYEEWHGEEAQKKRNDPSLGDDDEDSDESFFGLLAEDQDNSNDPKLLQLAEGGSYMHDFALPGPTVSMLDTMLDTLACQAPNSVDPLHDLGVADSLYEFLIHRYIHDGGDYKNDNPHTRPTSMSFNTLLRLAVNLPYQAGRDSLEFRDAAVTTATAAYQRIYECGVTHRNSATHAYMLQMLARYMPPSRIRGNMADAVFHTARYAGVMNDKVMAAYMEEVNAESNGPDFDEYIETKLRGKSLDKELPKRWSQYSKKHRYHPREDTY